MLIELNYQDWDASFSYAPPLRSLVVNTDRVLSARPCESRGYGPWMRVSLEGGESYIVQGTPTDLLPKEAKHE